MKAFWHELWNDLIEIPQSHPLLTHNIQRPSSDGRAYQSPSPAAYHMSLTLITGMRLMALASPPVTRTSAHPWRRSPEVSAHNSHNPGSNKHSSYDEQIAATADKSIKTENTAGNGSVISLPLLSPRCYRYSTIYIPCGMGDVMNSSSEKLTFTFHMSSQIYILYSDYFFFSSSISIYKTGE